MSRASDIRIAPLSVTGRQTAGSEDDGGLLTEIGASSESGADLVLLPQLSFSLYFPARRDREALELGERFPSGRMAAARRAAGDAWLAASAYQCVGEGVFYVSGQIGSLTEGTRLVQRQHRIEATAGRFEQMFISPGHESREVGDLPWGRTALLIGADARDSATWTELAGLGAQLILVSVSEHTEGWEEICRICLGQSTTHGISVCAVNRGPAPDEPDFAGGSFACDGTGADLTADAAGIYNFSIPTSGSVEP